MGGVNYQNTAGWLLFFFEFWCCESIKWVPNVVWTGGSKLIPRFIKSRPEKKPKHHADVGEKKNVLQEIQTAHPAPLSTTFGVD